MTNFKLWTVKKFPLRVPINKKKCSLWEYKNIKLQSDCCQKNLFKRCICAIFKNILQVWAWHTSGRSVSTFHSENSLGLKQTWLRLATFHIGPATTQLLFFTLGLNTTTNQRTDKLSLEFLFQYKFHHRHLEIPYRSE